jgi:glycosyltransferase involved in cell wall biosynthesis
MKVLFNGSMYSDKPTGVGIFTREIAVKLIQLGLINENSTIYTYSTDNITKLNKVTLIRLPGLLEKIFRNSISLHRMIWNYFFLPRIARDYDLVYSFSSHGSPFIKNQVITIHDVISLKYPSQHRMQYYYFKYLLPSIIKSSVKIITVSEYTKMEVIKYYHVAPEKIEVISGAADHLQKVAFFNTLDNERPIIEKLKNKRFFLAVGASYKHKNLERLIPATKMLNNNDLLVIVGSGNNDYCKALKEKYADAQIYFLDYVSSELLGYLYANCIANVYVSLYEGMGFPPYEAAIYNTVSIVSNKTALPEIYQDAVYYVDPESIAEIHNALELFSNDEINKEQYTRQFPALLEKYKWKHTATKIAEFINNKV